VGEASDGSNSGATSLPAAKRVSQLLQQQSGDGPKGSSSSDRHRREGASGEERERKRRQCGERERRLGRWEEGVGSEAAGRR
jgi:hypothetical protein